MDIEDELEDVCKKIVKKRMRTDERKPTTKMIKEYLWPPERRSIKQLIEYYANKRKTKCTNSTKNIDPKH